MKFMTFNSSCSYAGVANLLEFYGVETTDSGIALAIGLPYMFAFEDGRYIAGPMLQSAEWFNLYLNTVGFELCEEEVTRDRVCEYLLTKERAMLGFRVDEYGKHAVIYKGITDGKYTFLNNKWEASPERDFFEFTEQELVKRLDDTVMIACLKPVAPHPVDITSRMQKSIYVLEDMRRDMCSFCTQEKPIDEIITSMTTLFRALMLDGVSMTDLIGEEALHEKLKTLEWQMIQSIKVHCTKRLDAFIDISLLNSAIDDYSALIKRKLDTILH